MPDAIYRTFVGGPQDGEGAWVSMSSIPSIEMTASGFFSTGYYVTYGERWMIWQTDWQRREPWKPPPTLRAQAVALTRHWVSQRVWRWRHRIAAALEGRDEW